MTQAENGPEQVAVCNPRKVAVVLPVELRGDALHRDLIPTAYGLQELGHDVTVYTPSASAEVPGLKVAIAKDGDLTRGEFWQREAPEWALVLTWLGCPEILEALKASNATVVSKGDTDGLVSARRHPRSNWQRMILHKQGVVARARAHWHLAKRIGPLHRAEIRVFTRSVEAADALVVETFAAKRALERTLALSGYRAAARKIFVRWNPVQGIFSRGPLPSERERLIVGVARWDDPQKDSDLLRAALEAVLDTDPRVRVEMYGPRADLFKDLDRARVSTAGPVGNAELPRILRRARIVAFASRWEGLPIAALEGLASGCSVVGTRIGAFLDIEAAGGGRVAATRRPIDLAQAILDELHAWDVGRRSALSLGQHWRSRVDRRAVAYTYAELFADLSSG